MKRRSSARTRSFCLMFGAVGVAAACGGTAHEFENAAGASGSAGAATTAGSSSTPSAGRAGSGQSAAGAHASGGDGETPSTGGSPDTAGTGGSDSAGGSTDVPTAGKGGAGGSGGSGTAGSAGTGGSSSTACPTTHQCVARAPAGWSGPVIYAPKSSLPSCPTSYPTSSVTGGTGVTGSTTCQCACTATPQSSSCAAVNVTQYLDGGCSTSNGSGPISANACIDSGGGGISHRLTITAPTAQCASGTSSPLAAPVFSNPVLACGGGTEDAGSCASSSQACLPKPPAAAGADICVYKTGVADCPADYSASAQVVYKSWTDTRSCPGTCSCSGSGGVCSANRQKFGITGCTSATGGPIAFTSSQAAACIADDSFTAIQVGAPSVTAAPTCSGGSQPAGGSLVGAGAVTVCCR